MTSRVVRTSMRLRRRDPEVIVVSETPMEHQQAPVVVPQVVSTTPPTIDVDAIEDDDDDVVISTASAFAQAKSKSAARSRAERGGGTGLSKSRARRRSDSANAESDERNKLRKSMAAAPEEELKFNCPICICPVTEETTTKCGHIFCKGCIKKAIACQGKCPTCRKNVAAKDLIRVFLPSR